MRNVNGIFQTSNRYFSRLYDGILNADSAVHEHYTGHDGPQQEQEQINLCTPLFNSRRENDHQERDQRDSSR